MNPSTRPVKFRAFQSDWGGIGVFSKAPGPMHYFKKILAGKARVHVLLTGAARRGIRAGSRQDSGMRASQMRPPCSIRKFLVATMLAAIVFIHVPTLVVSGGCDDPGNIGACNNSRNAANGVTILPQPSPSPSPLPTAPVQLASAGTRIARPWTSWLLTIVAHLVR
jgi:hypothetical protein